MPTKHLAPMPMLMLLTMVKLMLVLLRMLAPRIMVMPVLMLMLMQMLVVWVVVVDGEAKEVGINTSCGCGGGAGGGARAGAGAGAVFLFCDSARFHDYSLSKNSLARAAMSLTLIRNGWYKCSSVSSYQGSLVEFSVCLVVVVVVSGLWERSAVEVVVVWSACWKAPRDL